MPTDQRTKQMESLVRRLCALREETPWAEFKLNDAEPSQVGEYISALSNAAALEGRAHGYMLWGVEDVSHEIVGTTFRPNSAKRGGEDLIPWLTRGLSPQIHFTFDEVPVDGRSAVLLGIAAAYDRPTQFNGNEFIRVGSYKKKLKDYPDHERRLWKSFDSRAFESLTAADHLSRDAVLDLLDYESYFRLIRHQQPRQVDEIIEVLERAELIRWDIAEEWSITNLGALLIAKDLSQFPTLARKLARVIKYRGGLRLQAEHEHVRDSGYAVGFELLYEHVMGMVPSTENYETGIRENRPIYPSLAIRELLANMLVHQDLTLPGSGPMAELFDNRIEITNPGVPLIDTARFVDSPPISRNEKLGRALTLMNICEERGSGWDKIAFEVEVNQLPAPLIDVTDKHTRVTVFSYKPFKTLTRDERLRAVYLHSVLRHIQGEQTTNASVRERFGLRAAQVSAVSRLLAEAVEQGLLIPHDRDAGKRAMAYVPFWAGAADSNSEPDS